MGRQTLRKVWRGPHPLVEAEAISWEVRERVFSKVLGAEEAGSGGVCVCAETTGCREGNAQTRDHEGTRN